MRIRSTHPYGYHSREWGEVVATLSLLRDRRECYYIKWPDGDTDIWPVDDELDRREFDGEV